MNDDGGERAPPTGCCTPTGATPLDGRSGSDAVTSVSVRHGVYDLRETDAPGRFLSRGWTCTGGTVTGPHQVRVEDGDTVVCAATNDDVHSPGTGPIAPS